MADLTITAASVAKDTATAQTASGIAGETITAGMALYQLASDSKLYKADANSAAAIGVIGVSLHASLAGQPIVYQTSGKITIGATVAVGTIYVLSATAGGIAPSTDLASGWYTGIVGVATTTTVITLAINQFGAAVP